MNTSINIRATQDELGSLKRITEQVISHVSNLLIGTEQKFNHEKHQYMLLKAQLTEAAVLANKLNAKTYINVSSKTKSSLKISYSQCLVLALYMGEISVNLDAYDSALLVEYSTLFWKELLK